MTRIRIAEAQALAREAGFPLHRNSIRKLAEAHGLTRKFGRLVFVDAEGWRKLLDGSTQRAA